MIFKKYQSYIFNLFLKRFLLVSIIFFCLVIVVNFFEEVRFSEKYNAEIYYTFYLSLLNAPSLIFEIFPFIFIIFICLCNSYRLKLIFIKLFCMNYINIFFESFFDPKTIIFKCSLFNF